MLGGSKLGPILLMGIIMILQYLVYYLDGNDILSLHYGEGKSMFMNN